LPVASSPVVTSTGVSSVAATPVTVTNSDGSTQVDNLSCLWAADLFGAVTYSCSTATTKVTPPKIETSTVVQTNPDGTTTTQTITKSTPGSTVTGTTTGVPPPLDFDVPGVEVPKSTANVTYSVDDLGFGSGTCPSPIPLTVGGHSYSISYQPACDVATTYLKPALLAIASIMAYLICAGGIKET
jgi:hypothetical protein